MCGIVGYLGKRQATEVLIDGLSKLEYRGYDSAGVAINTGNELAIRKFKGRLAILAEDLQKNPIDGHLGRTYKMGNSWRTIRCKLTSSFQYG